MPQLINARHEMFARGLSMGKTQLQAYSDAGYEHSSSNAHTMARRPDIVERVKELIDERGVFGNSDADMDMDAAKEKLQADGTVDPIWVLTMLMDNVKLARDSGQFAASNKALELLGKEIGLFQEGNKGRNDADKEKQAEEAAKRSNAIPVEAVNRLLDKLGFDGTIDLKTMEPVSTPKKRGRPTTAIRNDHAQ
jgi:hypothetical protein